MIYESNKSRNIWNWVADYLCSEARDCTCKGEFHGINLVKAKRMAMEDMYPNDVDDFVDAGETRYCFACLYAHYANPGTKDEMRDNCKHCPVDWGGNVCLSRNTPYRRLIDCIRKLKLTYPGDEFANWKSCYNTTMLLEASRLAEQIAQLPVKEGVRTV